MESISELWEHRVLTGIDRILAARCVLESDAYARNIRWLPQGRTGWWRVDDKQQFRGIAVLIDSKMERTIEVWGARVGEGLVSGRYRREPVERRWELRSDGPFEFIGAIRKGTINSVMRRQIGEPITYFQRPKTRARSSRALKGNSLKFDFSPEFSGDKDVVTPGAYTAHSAHGLIVQALYEQLRSAGYRGLHNKFGRDLQGVAIDGQSHLFEVKTDLTPPSVHRGLGQLMVYEIEAEVKCKKFLVLPEDERTRDEWIPIMRKLGISVLQYIEGAGGYRIEQP